MHVRDIVSASSVLTWPLLTHTFSFTRTVWGATVLITVTGFSWAITQWVPFSLVSLSSRRLHVYILTAYQLAEAILTEPGPATMDDGGSILLEDTRANRTPAGDTERDGFLQHRHSESDEEDEESDDDTQKAKSARLGVLGGNSDARVSHLNIGGDHSDEDYEFVGSARSSRARQNGEDFEPGQRGGGLSAKAGIILVRILLLFAVAQRLLTSSQGIHNVFIVIPQFLVTGLSSIVFAIFDPKKVVVPHRPVNNGTAILDGLNNTADVLSDTLLRRSEFFVDLSIRSASESDGQSSSSIVYIFRFVSAFSPLLQSSRQLTALQVWRHHRLDCLRPQLEISSSVAA